MTGKIRKMITAFVLGIIDFATVCVSGAAWFSATRINQASAMQVQMYTHELDMSYRVYKYSDDAKAPINVTGATDALTLQQYDSVIKSRNEHTPIIIEFTITGMALGDDIPVYINTHCTNSSATDRVLSNIVGLKFDVIDSFADTDAATIYNTAVEHFENMEAVQFKENSTKNLDIVYTLNDYASLITNGDLTLYVQLGYSESLIDEFEFTLSDTTTTSFENDLTLINCYTNE